MDIQNNILIEFYISYFMSSHITHQQHAWVEHCCVLRDVVGDRDLSGPALIQDMVWSEED